MTDLVAAVVDGQVMARLEAGSLVLPSAPRGEDGPDLAALAAVWGARTVRPLAPELRPDPDSDVRLHVVQPVPALTGGVALDARALDRLSAPAAVVEVLAAELAVLAGQAPRPARRPDWYRLGWQDEVDGWVDATLTARGVRRTGTTVPVKIWSLSALLRVPTTDGEVVLKAVGEPFTAEPAVTSWLSTAVPGRVPMVLAVEPRRGWTLMRAFSGPDGGDRPESGPAAARVLAQVQLTATERLEGLRATGLPVRDLSRTLAALTDVVRDSPGLSALDVEERARVTALPAWLGPRFAALEELGLPTSLVHGDLHSANYVITAAGVLLFDWTDAALGHPALDAVLLASSAGQGAPAHEQDTLTAWSEVWRAAYPEADVAAALALAPAAHLAYQAVSYDGLGRAQEDASRWQLGGLTTRLLRRLLALRDQP
ncbi:hypothetical protein GCM10009616_33800 [Microlunatus lacustris]